MITLTLPMSLKKYTDNIQKYNSFLIQSQPVKLIYKTGIEVSLPAYTNTRCSMFLSLCQKTCINHIFAKKHPNMYEITNNIITLPEGYTKWVIHENNQTVLNAKKNKK